MLLALQQHHIQNIAFHQFKQAVGVGYLRLGQPAVILFKIVHQLRQQIVANGLACANAQKTRPASLERPLDGLGPLQHFVRQRPQARALMIQPQMRVHPVKQAHAEVPLQFLQGLGNRALGQKQGLCGLCEILKPRHSQKNLQLFECHISV